MPARFVDLQGELRRSDDQIETSGRRLRRSEQREYFLANLPALAREIELLDEFPSGRLKISAERIGIGAALKLITFDRERLDAAAHFGSCLFDVASDGRREDFLLPIR